MISRYEPDIALQDVENPNRFSCHAKVADRYRAGRVLLAGDAAHVCSPDQGHGMNCGLQDSLNLAWKLALVCDDDAPASLLDSYGAERRPIALEIAESGEAMEAMGRFDGAEARAQRDEQLHMTFANPEIIHSEAVAEAELNIDYKSSPIVAGELGGPVGAGARLPDLGPVRLPRVEARRLHELTHRPGHTLLAVARGDGGGRLLPLLRELEEIVVHSPIFGAAFVLATEPGQPTPIGAIDSAAADELCVSGLTLLAVRPDRHVGLRVDRADTTELERYTKLLGRQTS